MSDLIKEQCSYKDQINGYCEFCGRLGICYPTKEEMLDAMKRQKEKTNDNHEESI